MSDQNPPPPFVVGQKYRDRLGEYTVIAADQDRIVIERPDGHRTNEDAAVKARIHRNVAADREANPVRASAHRRRRPGEATGRRKELMERILQLEADGTRHTGVEIDRFLAVLAGDLGYTDDDVLRLNPETGRSAFANDGDWAKAKMTEAGLHEVVGKAQHWENGTRRARNVYCITPRGLDELRNRG